MKVDFLIVGQGLAGSLLAWNLVDRSKRILVVDRDEEVTSSKVAAGLLTPISGSRFHLPDGLEERLAFAHEFYWNLEERLGETIFHHHRIARLFRDLEESAIWEKKKSDSPSRYEDLWEELSIDPDTWKAPHGGFEMKRGGWLDVPKFLQLTQQMLLERAAYAIAEFDSNSLVVEEDHVAWKNVEARNIIFAQGWEGNRNQFFDWVPMRPTWGEILDLEASALSGLTQIVNRGGWILPKSRSATPQDSCYFRAGSTYHTKETPASDGKEEILKKIGEMTDVEMTVHAVRSARRPIIRRSQIFAGRHPSHPNLAFFNGMGSKGVLNGPWYADRFVRHLLDGDELPTDADLHSNLI